MFNSFFDYYSTEKQTNPNDCGYKDFYKFWKKELMQRVIRLFKWDGLPDFIPYHELEERLLVQGYCTCIKHGAVYSYFAEREFYFDNFTKMNWYSLDNSGIASVGKDCVIVANNGLKQSILPLIHEYSVLLAHNDLTFWIMLVNQRESHGFPIGVTDKDMRAIRKYRNDLINGNIASIQDKTMDGIKWIRTDSGSNDCRQFLDIRQDLLHAFYNDIGVQTVREKRANMVSEEVNGSDAMLLLNLNDMLESRCEGAKLLSNFYNTEIKVELATNLLDYGKEKRENAN